MLFPVDLFQFIVVDGDFVVGHFVALAVSKGIFLSFRLSITAKFTIRAILVLLIIHVYMSNESQEAHIPIAIIGYI